MSEKPSYEELETRIAHLEKAEKKLKSLEESLQDEIGWRSLLIQESRDGIVMVNQDCKVIEVNKKFADMLGYTMDEAMQLYAWDWDTEFSKEEMLELAKNVDDKGHHFETKHRCKDGSLIDVELSNNGINYRGKKIIFCICHDISDRIKVAQEQEEMINNLKEALAEVSTLRGILPICSFCKDVRDDEGYWEKVDIYIRKNSKADISHGICPDCMKIHYPEYSKDISKT
ncbi:PAS domain S-box protein [Gammaproteobacteria bacterium]|nr:PAS domain S-box protein [Gammaproteobacteria bacterium]